MAQGMSIVSLLVICQFTSCLPIWEDWESTVHRNTMTLNFISRVHPAWIHSLNTLYIHSIMFSAECTKWIRPCLLTWACLTDEQVSIFFSSGDRMHRVSIKDAKFLEVFCFFSMPLSVRFSRQVSRQNYPWLCLSVCHLIVAIESRSLPWMVKPM